MAFVRNWSVPVPLTGNIFLFGRVGSGKTCKLMTFVQGYHSKNYKLWDIFGGKRGEGPFWCFKSDDKLLWKMVEQETYDFPEGKDGPKQYKVNLLYPMFSTKLPKKLPEDRPNVKSKVFTIPLKEVEERHISLVLGSLGVRAKTLWQNIQAKTNKNSNCADVKALMDHKYKKLKADSLYNIFLKPLCDNHTLSGKDGDLNIDWIAEAEDRETVTVLCLDYVPERFHFFVMGYMAKKIMDLAMKNKIHKRNIGIFREASLFMKVVDSDKSREETTSIFRNLIVEIARYARSGFFLAMDTQDSSEVKGMIEGSDDLLGICEMPSPTSRETTCAPLKRDRRMSEHHMRFIATMPVHQIVVVTRGKKALILKRINPPRCRYWRSDYGNFFSLWKKEVDNWVDRSKFTDKIKEEEDARENFVLSLSLSDEEKKQKEVKSEVIKRKKEVIEDNGEKYEPESSSGGRDGEGDLGEPYGGTEQGIDSGTTEEPEVNGGRVSGFDEDDEFAWLR